jgi:hypothetical protein
MGISFKEIAPAEIAQAGPQPGADQQANSAPKTAVEPHRHAQLASIARGGGDI